MTMRTSSPPRRHALITGGAGFIGSHLAKLLVKSGCCVTAIDDLSTGRRENVAELARSRCFRLVVANVMDQRKLASLVAECTEIYHLAATVGVELVVKDPIRAICNNIHGTEAVLAVARRLRKKTFIASSSEVYGKTETIPFRETGDYSYGPTSNARWSYAYTKAIDEFLALALWKSERLPVVVGRLFNTVGPRQTGRYGMVIPRFLGQALRGDPITVYGDGQQTRCFAYVGEVARAIALLMRSDAADGEIFNIGSTQELTMNELAELVRRKTRSRSPIQHISYEAAYDIGFEDMRRRVPDVSKLKRLIGFVPKMSIGRILDRILADLRRKGGT